MKNTCTYACTPEKCILCEGTGKWPARISPEGIQIPETTCRHCKGTGKCPNITIEKPVR